jgi:hypothetical protein
MSKRLSKAASLALHKVAAFEFGVGEILAQRFSIGPKQHGWRDDICASLIEANPGLCDHHAGLIAAGEFEAAADVVGSALDRLAAADPILFMSPPASLAAHALLVYLTTARHREFLRDPIAYSHAQSRIGTNEDTRKDALARRRQLAAAGQPVPEPTDELGGSNFASGDTVSSRAMAEKFHRNAGIPVPFGLIGG